MKHIFEYSNFKLDSGETVLIHYWYSGMLTPVKILEKVGRRLLVTHNIKGSEIQNAPDEYIKSTEIVDKHRT